mgnify:CR=1 FL=1
MRKHLLKTLTLGLLLIGGGSLWATQYCRETVTATVGEEVALTFSAEKTGPLETTFKLTSTATTFSITRNAQQKLYQTLIQNTGGGVLAEDMPDQNSFNNEWTYDSETNTLTLVVRWATYPTSNLQLYVVAYRATTESGTDITGYTFTDIDVQGSCTPDNTKPTMTSASVTSYSGSSAVLAVAATDENDDGNATTVSKFRVVDTNNSIDATLTASNGSITLTGLTGNTAYNLTVYAVDDADNQSESGITCTAFTTSAMYSTPQSAPATPTIDANNVVCIYSGDDHYTSAVNNGGQGTAGTVDNFTYYSQTGDYYFWYTNNPKTGMGNGVNIATCNRLHIDMWIADKSIRYVKGIRVQGDGFASYNYPFVFSADQSWVSFDIPISELYNDQFTSTAQQVQAFCFSFDGCAAANYTTNQLVQEIFFGNIYFYNDGTMSSDATAPVMTSATLYQKRNNSAFISVAATDKNDNDEDGAVAFYRINGTDYTATNGKIQVTGLTANTAYSFDVYAVDAYGNVSENYINVSFTTRGDNLALNQTTTVGAAAGDDYVGSKAVDGNTGTRWASGQSATHPNQDWIYVDLGASYTLDAVMISWETARPANYVIEYSSDASSWTTAQTLSTMPVASQTEFAEYDMNSVVARYVRMRTTSNDGGYENMKYGASIWELEVYGSAATADQTAPVFATGNDAPAVTSATSSTITVTAKATDDNGGTITYKLYNGDTEVGSATATSGETATIVAEGLTANTEYTLTLKAYDASNNEAVYGTSLVQTTDAASVEQYCEKVVYQEQNTSLSATIKLTVQQVNSTQIQVVVGDPNKVLGGSFQIDYVKLWIDGNEATGAVEHGSAGGDASGTGFVDTFTPNNMSSFTVTVMWHNSTTQTDNNARYTTNAITITGAELCNDGKGLRTGVDEQAAEMPAIGVENGVMRIHTDEAQPVQVFSVAGQMLYNETTTDVNLALARGIYMVRIGSQATKVLVK